MVFFIIVGIGIILLLIRIAAAPRKSSQTKATIPAPPHPVIQKEPMAASIPPSVSHQSIDVDLLDDEDVDEDELLSRAERRAAKAKLMEQREDSRQQLYQDIITIFYSTASKQEKLNAIFKAEEHYVAVYKSRLNPDRVPNLMAAFRKVGKHYEEVIKGPNHTKVQRIRYRIRKQIREGEKSVKDIPWDELYDIIFPDQVQAAPAPKPVPDDVTKLKRRQRTLHTFISKRPESENIQAWKEELAQIDQQLARLQDNQ